MSNNMFELEELLGEVLSFMPLEQSAKHRLVSKTFSKAWMNQVRTPRVQLGNLSSLQLWDNYENAQRESFLWLGGGVKSLDDQKEDLEKAKQHALDLIVEVFFNQEPTETAKKFFSKLSNLQDVYCTYDMLETKQPWFNTVKSIALNSDRKVNTEELQLFTQLSVLEELEIGSFNCNKPLKETVTVQLKSLTKLVLTQNQSGNTATKIKFDCPELNICFLMDDAIDFLQQLSAPKLKILRVYQLVENQSETKVGQLLHMPPSVEQLWCAEDQNRVKGFNRPFFNDFAQDKNRVKNLKFLAVTLGMSLKNVATSPFTLPNLRALRLGWSGSLEDEARKQYLPGLFDNIVAPQLEQLILPKPLTQDEWKALAQSTISQSLKHIEIKTWPLGKEEVALLQTLKFPELQSLKGVLPQKKDMTQAEEETVVDNFMKNYQMPKLVKFDHTLFSSFSQAQRYSKKRPGGPDNAPQQPLKQRKTA